MAAAVAVMLYLEAPRVAFESQRTKEDLLIERGEQYKRAIQLYVRKYKRYPTRLEELDKENPANIHFLRQRYKDPMTGKDEWRIIHAGPGGVLLDSQVQKPPGLDDKDKGTDKEKKEGAEAATPAQTLVGGMVGGGVVGGGVAPAVRPSDRPLLPAGGMTGMPVSTPNMAGQYGDPNAQGQYGQPTGQYGQPLQIPPLPGQSAQPGQRVQQFVQPGQPPYPQGYPYPQTQPGQAQPQFPYPQPGQVQQYPYPQPGQPGYPYPQVQPGQAVPGLPFAPGQVQPGQVPYTPGFPVVNRPPVAPTTGQPFQQPFLPQPYPPPPINSQTGGAVGMPIPGTGPNPALDIIKNLLTTPRPGGPTGTSVNSPSPAIGGGIAGVASTLEAEGIKVYNDRTKYNEWEFIYDLKRDKTAFGMTPGAPGQVMGTGPSREGVGMGPQTPPFGPQMPPQTPSAGRGR